MKKRFFYISSVIVLLVVGAALVYFLARYRADFTPGNHPLPTLTHWTDSFSSQELAMIERGHHITLALPLFSKDSEVTASLRGFDIKTILAAKAQNLPLSFPTTQWEDGLKISPYKDIDSTNGTFTGSSAMASSNPLNIDKTTNTVSSDPDPLGPAGQIDKWREVGSNWASSKTFQFMEGLYPNPPQVNFISNNEATRARWPQMPNSKRYQELYVATGREALVSATDLDNFRRRIVGDGWIERYSAMIASFRNGLANQNWKNNSLVTAYSSFGPNYFGRYWEWGSNGSNMAPTTYTAPDLSQYANTIPRIAPQPYAFDGSSEEVYLAPYYILTDHIVASPQIESMNWLFMLEETRRQKPNYWFELITWDGHKPLCSADIPFASGYCCTTLTSTCDRRTYLGPTWTPARYAAMVQFSMWLTRPNSVREFRFPLQTWDSELPYFLGLTKAVDRVYNQPVLTDFWQNGNLVENPSGHHPYQINSKQTVGYTDAEIKARYGVGRWFYLDNVVDGVTYNSAKFKDNIIDPTNAIYQTVLVYPMALTKGTAPNREWLVYAHSPEQDRTGVKITIPGYKDITVNVGVAGNFYLVKENDNTVTEITDKTPQLAHLIITPDNPLVTAGTTQQFTIKGLDQFDQDISTGTVSWSATGGTINQSGLFTAGSVEGNFEITAQSGAVSEKFKIQVGNLAGRWQFDEGSGQLVYDSSGQDNYCYSSARWAAGKQGSAAEFKDDTAVTKKLISGTVVSCDNTTYLTRPNEVTIAAWVKVDNVGAPETFHYIASNASDYYFNSYGLAYRNPQVGQKPEFDFYVWNDTTNNRLPSKSTLELNKWYFVVGQFKPGEYLRLYINGVLENEITTGVASKITAKQNDFLIGNKFDGLIDDVQIYNRVLSAAEIGNLYGAGNLILNKSVDKTNAKTGDTLQYKITYQNTKSEALSNVVITDILSDKLTLVGTPTGATVNGQIITWTIPSVVANSPPVDLIFEVKVK